MHHAGVRAVALEPDVLMVAERRVQFARLIAVGADRLRQCQQVRDVILRRFATDALRHHTRAVRERAIDGLTGDAGAAMLKRDGQAVYRDANVAAGAFAGSF